MYIHFPTMSSTINVHNCPIAEAAAPCHVRDPMYSNVFYRGGTFYSWCHEVLQFQPMTQEEKDQFVAEPDDMNTVEELSEDEEDD